MGRKRIVAEFKKVELHIKLPHELNEKLNQYLNENKSLSKTEVTCNALNDYLREKVIKIDKL